MATSTSGRQPMEYCIPDLLHDWPWARRLSAHYVEAKAESSAWVHSYRPFDVRGQKSFDACDLSEFVNSVCISFPFSGLFWLSFISNPSPCGTNF